MQESITIVSIGIRCIHMRTSYDLKQVSDKYNVKINLAKIKNDVNNLYVNTDDPLELMLLGLKNNDICKIKIVGATGLGHPAMIDVLGILEAKAVATA